MVSVCIILVTNDTEHFLVFLFTILYLSLGSVCINLLPILNFELFLVLHCKSSLYIVGNFFIRKTFYEYFLLACGSSISSPNGVF